MKWTISINEKTKFETCLFEYYTHINVALKIIYFTQNRHQNFNIKIEIKSQ